MDQQRRTLLNAGIAAGAAALLVSAGARAGTPSAKALGETPPANGKPGEFDFLAGEWKISHRRLKSPGEWDAFTGEATCFTILGGVGSVEELRIPQRDFMGLGLRILDLNTRIWQDYWVNAKSGALVPPGLPGNFVDGVGLFIADDVDGDKPIRVRGMWDRITGNSHRWSQAVSRDGGKTWEDNWLMDWVRA